MGKSYIPVSAFVSAGTMIRKGQPVALCARRTESTEEDEEGLEDHLVAMVKPAMPRLSIVPRRSLATIRALACTFWVTFELFMSF